IGQRGDLVAVARRGPFGVGGVLGIAMRVRLLFYPAAGLRKPCLAVSLPVFGTYALLAPRLPAFTGGGKPVDATIGFIGGILGGIGGYSGVLPTIWTQLRGWPKETARAVYQPYVIVIQQLTLASTILVPVD